MTPEDSGRALLTGLAVQHPEWRPLLAVLRDVQMELERAAWEGAVPALEPSASGAPPQQPLLAGAVISITPSLVSRWVHRLMRSAANAGVPADSLAEAVTGGRLDALSLFAAALSHDVDRLDDLARAAGGDHGVLRGLAPVIAMPMLHACRRAWAARLPAGWAFGHCPICGGWPSLAEIRGLGGGRYLRCGPCGGDWKTEWLRCPFCTEGDHQKLGALMASDGLARPRIDVCDGCHGYVKSMTTLASISPGEVVLHDLATLGQDVIALEHGYRRPQGSGQPMAIRVVAEPSPLRGLLCRWR
jgi:FdhE protein